MARTATIINMPARKQPRVNPIKPRRETKYQNVVKDPELDFVVECLEKSTLSWKAISDKCGVSLSTLNNWRFGKTRRPQNVTIRFVMQAIGYRRGEWVRS